MFKNTFVLIEITCPVALAITRTTKHSVQTMFALLETINILNRNVYSYIQSVDFNGQLSFLAWHGRPPNVPQARPIESLWGIFAHKVYEG